MGFFCVDGFIGGPINYKSAYGTFRVKLVGIVNGIAETLKSFCFQRRRTQS